MQSVSSWVYATRHASCLQDEALASVEMPPVTVVLHKRPLPGDAACIPRANGDVLSGTAPPGAESVHS